jgi:uncharacterized protein YlxW (UPF0749 family)
MNENKTAKYLKYAIGEIVLVVVGILIALQINNWNEERKLNLQRLELIEDLKSDFRSNLAQLEGKIESGETVVDKLSSFLKIASADNSHLSVDEIKHLAPEFGGIVFQPAMSA